MSTTSKLRYAALLYSRYMHITRHYYYTTLPITWYLVSIMRYTAVHDTTTLIVYYLVSIIRNSRFSTAIRHRHEKQ